MQTHEVINSLIKSGLDTGLEVQTGLISDTYHTFDELYEYRKILTAILFNSFHRKGLMVRKSWKHSDGEWCFGVEGKWFIVAVVLPEGQVSFHYKAKDWNLFQIPDQEQISFEYDGHTPSDALKRLFQYNERF